MKKYLMMFVMLFASLTFVTAQTKQASIKFDKLTYNFGTFSEKTPVQKCAFTFTNKGTAPLVINQAVASYQLKEVYERTLLEMTQQG